MELVRKFQHELLWQIIRIAHLKAHATLREIQQSTTDGCAISHLDLNSEIDIASGEFSIVDFHGSSLNRLCRASGW
jgi:hypothetical protein